MMSESVTIATVEPRLRAGSPSCEEKGSAHGGAVR